MKAVYFAIGKTTPFFAETLRLALKIKHLPCIPCKLCICTQLTLTKANGCVSQKSGSGTKPGGGECRPWELNEVLEKWRW